MRKLLARRKRLYRSHWIDLSVAWAGAIVLSVSFLMMASARADTNMLPPAATKPNGIRLISDPVPLDQTQPDQCLVWNTLTTGKLDGVSYVGHAVSKDDQGRAFCNVDLAPILKPGQNKLKVAFANADGSMQSDKADYFLFEVFTSATIWDFTTNPVRKRGK